MPFSGSDSAGAVLRWHWVAMGPWRGLTMAGLAVKQCIPNSESPVLRTVRSTRAKRSAADMSRRQDFCGTIAAAWAVATVWAGVAGVCAGLIGSTPAFAQNNGWLPEILKPERQQGAAHAKPKLPSPSDMRRHRLDGVRSWGYQLRLLRFPEIAASPLDLVVIDHALSAGRRFVHQFAPDLIELGKRKPDGGHRLVLAYLSIGEAERYRFYWDQAWYDAARKPAWLGALNLQWEGNYLVRFWHPEWQRIILDGPDSYLGRIKAAGFDGIYIDRADVHAEWAKEKPDAEAAMATFIQRLATEARRDNPNFLVIMQNAEELAGRKIVLEAIDGIAKEDLYYGIDHQANRNVQGDVESSLGYLRQAKRAGRRIFVVEYLDDPIKIRDVRRRAAAEGFVTHFTGRDLGDLMPALPESAVPRTEAPGIPR